MAAISGNSGVVKIGSGTLGEVRNFTVETSADVFDSSCIGTEWRTHAPGLKDWNAQIEAFFDDFDTQAGLVIGATVALELYPGGTEAGKQKLAGSGVITAISVSVAHDALVTVNATIEGAGALARSTVATTTTTTSAATTTTTTSE
jgi:predicted secreted protein